MKKDNLPPSRPFDNRAFLLLVVVVSIAFVWIVQPFYEAILWATILAILFFPMYRRLCAAWQQRRTLAALTAILAAVVLVIAPTAVITGLLLQEGYGVYQRVQSGELDFARYANEIIAALPGWVTGLLESLGVSSFGAIQAKLSAGLTRVLQFLGAHAVNVGQYTLDFLVSFFIMLYLLFFLLRDGDHLSRHIRDAIPLPEDLQRDLAASFANVIRATIKGNLVVALVQGALGALIFWFLGIRAAVFWGVVMAFLSLLPAIGAALIWLPVAVYLLVTGSIWQGVLLTAYGVLVIGLVDNVLRPVLVGKQTRMPDYVVLISTLGGMAILGFNGFVIGPVVAALFIAVWDVVAGRREGVR